jgi:hypothetical protein
MTGVQLARIFQQEVSKPTEVCGDAWGIDATTEDILRLINTPADELTAEDFAGYLGYCTTGGDDDLRYLFPPILRIWEAELSRPDSVFTQYFHAEVCRTDFVERALSDRLRRAATEFMVRALSERLAAESSLRIHGKTTSHDWFGFLASFGVFTTALPSLWGRVWESSRRGHAVALLQCLSCLLYEGENPIFAPWTCDKGGGPPELWGYDSLGFDECWKAENLKFLSSALSSGSIRGWLRRVAANHAEDEVGAVATQFLHRLAGCAAEVDERIGLLLMALRTPSGVSLVTWHSLLDAATQPES